MMFYVFEGIDGSGKTTQARLLARHLRDSGSEVVEVREPGGTPLGEKIREILLSPESGELRPEVEIFLFMAARAHLCSSVIRPALDRGSVVIADRFLWSSVVYQGIVSGLGAEEVLRLGKLAVKDVDPTVNFIVDIDPELSFERLKSHDRLERRGLEFQKSVREGYLSLAATFPERFAVVDGSGRPEEIHRRVLAALAETRQEKT